MRQSLVGAVDDCLRQATDRGLEGRHRRQSRRRWRQTVSCALEFRLILRVNQPRAA